MMLINLKKLREAKNLSQSELAEKVNCQQQTIAKYESLKCSPSLDIAIKLADALNTSIDYLAGKTDDPNRYKLYDPNSFSQDDAMLFENIRNLSDKQKELIKLTINNLK